MLSQQIISQLIKPLGLSSNTQDALNQSEALHIQHIPIVENNELLGVLNTADFIEDEIEPLINFEQFIQPVSIHTNEHIYAVIKKMTEHHISVLPVVNADNEYAGAITYETLLPYLNNMMGAAEPGAVIELEVEAKQYSLGEISRIVETNDAQITQLNSSLNPQTGIKNIILKINKLEVSAIVATFQRYDYNIINYYGEEQYENEMQHNYNHLMNYLEI